MDASKGIIIKQIKTNLLKISISFVRKGKSMVDVLILNYNDSETTISLTKKIINYECIHHILIVDNCSSDNSVEKIRNICNDKVIIQVTDKNGGYGYGNNFGIRYLKKTDNPDYILLANPDIFVTEDVIKKLVLFLKENQDYVIVAPFMLNSQCKKMANTSFKVPSCWKYIFSIGFLYTKLHNPFLYSNLVDIDCDYKEVDAVAGSLFLMNTDKMIKHGMFDENIFLYCEEISLGLKLKKSPFKLALLPRYQYMHNHSVSIDKTIKSAIDKQKVLLTSKQYVIRKHYHANAFQMFVTRILSKISMMELKLVLFIKK